MLFLKVFLLLSCASYYFVLLSPSLNTLLLTQVKNEHRHQRTKNWVGFKKQSPQHSGKAHYKIVLSAPWLFFLILFYAGTHKVYHIDQNQIHSTMSIKNASNHSNHIVLKLIQGTCRLSLKMGRGDEQKPLMHCIIRR